MRVFWRLATVRDRTAAFGGSRLPTRWCWRGRPVYAASSIALAALERLVYLNAPPGHENLPVQYLFRIEVPQHVLLEEVRIEDLPSGWINMRPLRSGPPHPSPLQVYGDRWVTERRTAALLVPSAHVPEEPNVLLNREHPHYQELTVTLWRPFGFDTRLAARFASIPRA